MAEMPQDRIGTTCAQLSAHTPVALFLTRSPMVSADRYHAASA